MQQESSPKDQIILLVREACQALTKASSVALTANKLAPSVPVIKELAVISQRLNSMMSEINKLQGL